MLQSRCARSKAGVIEQPPDQNPERLPFVLIGRGAPRILWALTQSNDPSYYIRCQTNYQLVRVPLLAMRLFEFDP